MKVDVLLFPLSRGDIKGDNCAILIGGVYAAADDDVDGGPVSRAANEKIMHLMIQAPK